MYGLREDQGTQGAHVSHVLKLCGDADVRSALDSDSVLRQFEDVGNGRGGVRGR